MDIFSFFESKKPKPAQADKSFIKIRNSKLEQVGFCFPCYKDIRVVSIIGKARLGKSTFLNLLTAYLNNENSVFPTQNTDENCTLGIDAHFNPDGNIILLDCQGIEHDNSANDSKLLLLIYLISDVIIYNERNILTNATLQGFQSMISFMNYLDIDNTQKPHLLFRISDLDLKLDPAENLTKLLAKKDDQYQNIRESIHQLFDNPRAIHTYSLDRNEKQALDTNQHIKVLSTKENGFVNAIEQVLETASLIKPHNAIIWFARLEQCIHLINSSVKIDYKKLDLYEHLTHREIQEWKRKYINLEFYNNEMMDGTQKTYDLIINPREESVKILEAEFKQRFKLLNNKIKSKYLDDIISKFSIPILKAHEDSLTLGKSLLNSILHEKYKTIQIDRISEPFKKTEAAKQFKNYMDSITECVKYLYNPVREKYNLSIEDIYNKINDEYNAKLLVVIKEKTKLHDFTKNQEYIMNRAIKEEITKKNRKILIELGQDPQIVWTSITSNIKATYYKNINDFIQENRLYELTGIISTESDNRYIKWSRSDKPYIYNECDTKGLWQLYLDKRKQLVHYLFNNINSWGPEILKPWLQIVSINSPFVDFITLPTLDDKTNANNGKQWSYGLPYDTRVPVPYYTFKSTWRRLIKMALENMVNERVISSMSEGWCMLRNYNILTKAQFSLKETNNNIISIFQTYFYMIYMRHKVAYKEEIKNRNKN